MRFLTTATLVLVTLLFAQVAHADTPTLAPDLSTRFRLELAGGAAWAKADPRGSARVGFGVQLSEHTGLAFDARHLFVEEGPAFHLDDYVRAYDDLGVGLRLRAPLGRVELFFTPELVLAFLGYNSDEQPPRRQTALAKGVSLRAGVETWLGGALWVGLAVNGTVVSAGFESIDAHAGVEAYATVRF
jgi:hypothetical protein